MIKIYLGNPGSGKTLSAVREMVMHQDRGILNYTNIIPMRKIKNLRTIDSGMIFIKEVIGAKRDGTPIESLKMNVDYWKDIDKKINVVLDEAHTVMNPRRSMSKVNIIMTDWLALIRRVLGNRAEGSGDLVLITQLWNRIDIIARDMCTHVRYHCMHYTKQCNKCGMMWRENSQMPELLEICPRCAHYGVKEGGHVIEVWKFDSMKSFLMWMDFGSRSYYAHTFISGVNRYFRFYDTLSWDNLVSDLY